MMPAPAQLWVYRAKPLRVIDGDTCEMLIDCGFRNQRSERLRLLGVDTPERSEPGWAAAKAYAERWLAAAGEGWSLVVETQQADSFGRYLALVWRADGRCLNADLLEAGLAVAYRR